ncbi:MAG: hypothetical protein J4G05_09845 [Chlorobi bacterium]|nr:hypothetical protein [Chlorobiota bacterium]
MSSAEILTYYRVDSTSGGLQKRATPWRIERGDAQSSTESVLRVRVIPNPATDRAEVWVLVREEAEVRVSIWSLLGKPLAELTSIIADGIYT